MSVKLRNVCLLLIMTVLTACGDSTQTAPAVQTQPATSPATSAVITTNAPTQSAVTTQPPATTKTAAPTQPLTTINTATTQASLTPPLAAIPVVQTTTAASDPQPGLILFRSQGCAGCHGGDKATGQLGPPLNSLEFPEEGLLRQVRSGAKPMPAYSAQKLPDDDVKLIYAYLISLKGK